MRPTPTRSLVLLLLLALLIAACSGDDDDSVPSRVTATPTEAPTAATTATATPITISAPSVRSSERRRALVPSSSRVREMLAFSPHSAAAVTTSE